MQFLDESLTAKEDNILQKNVFIVLSSTEMIGLLRVYAIFHVAICIPIRYLAGSSHTFAEHDWSCRSMGRVLDILYDALQEISDDGGKLINIDFMLGIFQTLRAELPPFDQYLYYMFENKLNPTLPKYGSTKQAYDDSKVPGLDLVIVELFAPQRQENIDTDELVIEMAKIAADCWISEFEDVKKATSDYVSKANGKYSWENTPEEVHQKILGTFATNDIAEQPFGRFSWQLDSYNRITFGNAAVSAQARMNGDFDRKELGYDVDGAFIRSTDHEQQSLIVTAMKCAKEERMKESEEMKKTERIQTEKEGGNVKEKNT